MIRAGELERAQRLITRHELSNGSLLDYAADAIRLARHHDEAGAERRLEWVASRLPAGTWQDELTVLTEPGFDIPWWSHWLLDPP